MPSEALDADQRANTYLNGKPSFTIDQAAAQLDRANLSWASGLGQATTVTYAYRSTLPAQMPDDTAGFHRFTNSQIDATERALAAWAKVANITFQRVEDNGSAYSDNATILFGDYTSGEAGSSAFTYLPGSRAPGAVEGDVWVNSTLPENINYLSLNTSYGYLTLMHEIGHSIGLSHPSDYDSSDSDAQSITYAQNASYAEDSLEYSIMSYFDARSTGADIDQDLDSPAGPLIDDIAAAQRLYGANTSTGTGNDVYSVNFYSWESIWDAGGTDMLDASVGTSAQKIDLRPGSFSDIAGGTGNVSIALGTVVENAIGGSGSDTIIGNDVGNRIDGGGGDDTITGGFGADTYIGGLGSDRAVLGGNVHDYHLVNGGSGGLIIVSDNGSGSAWIDPSIEVVQFQNGQYLSYADVAAYVPAVQDNGSDFVAATTGRSFIGGTAGHDILYVDGNIGDYQLSRVQAGAGQAQQGDFVLSAHGPDNVGFYASPGSTIDIGQTIDQIDFRDGQYLSLNDLPAYVSGSPVLFYGSTGDDLLYQDTSSPFQLFAGGDGHDEAFLNGNVGDYVARDFYGDSETLNGLLGIELVATNGSGALFIDSSTDTVHYQNGQYLSFGDIMAYEAPAGPTLNGVLHFAADAAIADARLSGTADPNDIALVDGNASDYTLGRSGGDFVMTNNASGHAVQLAETIDTVEFVNGQYLALKDLGAYLSGSDVYTNALDTGDVDDLLYTSGAGNQYVIGDGGFDNVFLNGNVQDYTLQHVNTTLVYDLPGVEGYFGNPPAYFSGYELHATNGSGDIYIDQSTESIHFQNGQYLAFNDLPAYIHGYG